MPISHILLEALNCHSWSPCNVTTLLPLPIVSIDNDRAATTHAMNLFHINQIQNGPCLQVMHRVVFRFSSIGKCWPLVSWNSKSILELDSGRRRWHRSFYDFGGVLFGLRGLANTLSLTLLTRTPWFLETIHSFYQSMNQNFQLSKCFLIAGIYHRASSFPAFWAQAASKDFLQTAPPTGTLPLMSQFEFKQRVAPLRFKTQSLRTL